MKRMLLAALLIIAGLTVLTYPWLSDYWNSRQYLRVIDDYQQAVAQMSAAERSAALAAAEEYNRRLYAITSRDPLTAYPDNAFAQDAYLALLNIDRVIGYLEIPSLNLRLPIFQGTTEDVLQVGVGHLAGTSLPVGGNGNHVALTAHAGLPHSKLFTDLAKIQLGDVFYLHVFDRHLAYAVDAVTIVEPTDIALLQPVADKDYVTLITCTPLGVNSHRLLVRGERTGYPAAEDAPVARPVTRGEIVVLLTTILLLLLLILTILARYRRRGGRGQKRKGG